MKSGQIERDLDLPHIKAFLVAHRNASQKERWYIRFYIPGPDRRYNPGIAVVPSYKVQSLTNALKDARCKMELLERKEYPGKYSEEIILRGEISDTLSIAATSKKSHFLFWSHKKVRLVFFVSSKTNTFSRSFNSDDVKKVISTLELTESLANNLFKRL